MVDRTVKPVINPKQYTQLPHAAAMPPPQRLLVLCGLLLTLAAERAPWNTKAAAANGNVQGLKPLPCCCCWLVCRSVLLVEVPAEDADSWVAWAEPAPRRGRVALLARNAGTLRTARTLLLVLCTAVTLAPDTVRLAKGNDCPARCPVCSSAAGQSAAAATCSSNDVSWGGGLGTICSGVEG